MNYFELFGLAPTVDVDVKAVEQRHRELSLSVHPDRLKGADAAARRKASELSASINEAVKVLVDPVRRATYLLKLSGVDLDSQESAGRLEPDPEFLEEILARREALEEVKAKRDLGAAASLARGVATQRDGTLQLAQQALRRHDFPQATTHLARLRYYARFLEEVDAFEQELAS